jgi:hypothetical protein
MYVKVYVSCNWDPCVPVQGVLPWPSLVHLRWFRPAGLVLRVGAHRVDAYIYLCTYLYKCKYVYGYRIL